MERLMLWRSSSNKNATSKMTDPRHVALSIDEHVSSWEIINPSDGEESDGFSYTTTTDDDDETLSPRSCTLDLTDVGHVDVSQPKDPSSDEEDERPVIDDDAPGGNGRRGLKANLVLTWLEGYNPETGGSYDYDNNSNCNDNYGSNYDNNDDDEDEDEGYEDEYDEDMVPYSVSDKFGKQRLGKMGKKANNAYLMKKSKRMPTYFYNKVV